MNLLRHFVALALLAAALPAAGAQFTVGPGGNQPSVSAAFGAAAANPGDDEIRIASGVRVETVSFAAPPAEAVRVSGGWNAGFSVRTADPTLTVLDGNAAGPTLFGTMTQGQVEIANLTVRNGRSLTGGGLGLDAAGSAMLLIESVIVHDNLAIWEFASNGGGMKINARENAVVEIRDSEVRNNRTESTANTTGGGGAYLTASESGQILVLRSTFANNVAESPSEPNAGGLSINSFGNARVQLVSCVVRDNLLRGGAGGAGSASGAGIASVHLGTSTASFRGNLVTGNLDEALSNGGQQLATQLANDAALELGDTEVSLGSGLGAMILAFDTSIADLTNLTIADNAGGGLLLNRSSTATGSLFNSILHGNGGIELSASLAPQTEANLIEGSAGAMNPGFVDAANGNYRLGAPSPAIDAGHATPPAGLGSVDADAGLRVVGDGVDIGAYEHGSLVLFADGFEP